MDGLLDKLKNNRGVMLSDTSMDAFYQEKLDSAIAEFKADDISDSVLSSDYGQVCIVYLACLIIDKMDRASNPTLLLMKNTLSNITKGERYAK